MRNGSDETVRALRPILISYHKTKHQINEKDQTILKFESKQQTPISIHLNQRYRQHRHHHHHLRQHHSHHNHHHQHHCHQRCRHQTNVDTNEVHQYKSNNHIEWCFDDDHNNSDIIKFIRQNDVRKKYKSETIPKITIENNLQSRTTIESNRFHLILTPFKQSDW